jgi:hypothetical protein
MWGRSWHAEGQQRLAVRRQGEEPEGQALPCRRGEALSQEGALLHPDFAGHGTQFILPFLQQSGVMRHRGKKAKDWPGWPGGGGPRRAGRPPPRTPITFLPDLPLVLLLDHLLLSCLLIRLDWKT